MEDIDAISARLKGGENPKKIKLELAHEIVKMYHGEAEAKKAEETWNATFAKGGVPEDVQEVKLGKDELLIDALIKAGVVESKTDWRRLVKDGAVRTEKDEKIEDPNWKPSNGEAKVIKIGKRRFVKIRA